MLCYLMKGRATPNDIAAHVAKLKRRDEQQAAKKTDRIPRSPAPTAGRVPSRCASREPTSPPDRTGSLPHRPPKPREFLTFDRRLKTTSFTVPNSVASVLKAY